MLLLDFSEVPRSRVPSNEKSLLFSIGIATLVHALPTLLPWKLDQESSPVETYQIELLPMTQHDSKDALPIEAIAEPASDELVPSRSSQPSHTPTAVDSEESTTLPTLPDPPSQLLDSAADSAADLYAPTTLPDVEASARPLSSVPSPLRSSSSSKQGSTTTSRAKGEALIDWSQVQRKIQRTIAAHQRYPVIAQEMGIEGSVRLRFSLAPSGRLIDPPEIIRSSGYALLDREALSMVRRAAPYISLPRPWSARRVTFEIPIGFSLDRP